MGIRFACHSCQKPLNIKNELAGRRGVCPECGIRFRIPMEDAEFSKPIETVTQASGQSAAGEGKRGAKREVTATAGVAVIGVAEQQQSDNAVAATVRSVESVTNAAQNQVGQGSQATPAQQPASSTKNAGDPVQVAIDLIASEATATWYVRPPSGGQYGPANGEVLKQWIEEGRVAKDALLWRDGWPQWREANEALPGICDTLPDAKRGDGEDIFGSEGISVAASKPQPSDDASFDNRSGDVQVQASTPGLRGSHDLGASRRKRSSRRIAMVAVLATLAIGLVVTLFLVAMQS